jgi:predicted 3-demethylubiquinone-9 3-methyltransferase (glyoxalase superfamily)
MPAKANGQSMARNTICLWCGKDAETAAHFYARTFRTVRSRWYTAPRADCPGGKKIDVAAIKAARRG